MLRVGLRLVALLALLGLLVPGVGEGQDVKDKVEKDKVEKDKDKAPEKDKAPAKDKAPEKDKVEKAVAPPKPPPNPWVKVGQLTGKVQSFQESNRSIQFEVQVPELNQNALVAIAQARIQMAQARTPQDLINAQTNMLQQQRNLYTMKTQTVSLKLHDEVKVRLTTPPAKFDEKGRLVTKYTPAQLKEMKGPDPTLPGYSAEISDIGANSIAQVTLLQHKDKLRPRAPQPAGMKKPENADADLLMAEDFKPQVGMILLVPTLAPGG